MRYLSAIEPILYLFGFVFGAWRGYEEFHASLTEKAPTAMTVEQFSTDYRGQNWLALRGRFALEHRQVQSSSHEVHQGKNLSYLRVPVVPERWQPDDPVQTVGVFGPFAPGEVDAWVQQHAGQPTDIVTGKTRSDVYDFRRLFPRLRSAKSVVYINSGTRPSGLGTALSYLGLCLVSIVLLIRLIHRELRTQ